MPKHVSSPKGVKPITSLADLTPDVRNANRGTARGLAMLERSLQETGAGRSILVDRNGRVIAGNKTLEQWGALAAEAQIEVVQTDGHTLVVVQREDLDLDDPQGLARKLAYYDNRTSETGLVWNLEVLCQDLQAGVDLNGLWSEKELEQFLSSIALPDPTPPAPSLLASECFIEIRCSQKTLDSIAPILQEWTERHVDCTVNIS